MEKNRIDSFIAENDPLQGDDPMGLAVVTVSNHELRGLFLELYEKISNIAVDSQEFGEAAVPLTDIKQTFESFGIPIPGDKQ